MSDKRQFSYTPIIVGVIIALIGILTGFYIADNARQQLAVNQKGSDMFFDDSLKAEPAVPVETAPLPLEELPPLDPVVVDVPLPDVVEDSIPEMVQPVHEHEADSQHTDEPVQEPIQTTTENPEEEPVEVDEFEEVPQEVIDSLG